MTVGNKMSGCDSTRVKGKAVSKDEAGENLDQLQLILPETKHPSETLADIHRETKEWEGMG